MALSIVPQNTNDDRFQSFNFEGHTFRAMTDKDGNPWFAATDACEAIGIGNVSMAVSRLPDEEKTTISLSDSGDRPYKMLLINEAGLYRLIFRSDKPDAEIFRKYVFSEVLPAIRKTGQYTPQQMTPLQQLRAFVDTLESQQVKLTEHDQRLIQLEARVQGEPDMHSVIGYCKLHRINVDLREAQVIGQRAKRVSVDRGLPVGKVSDPRFGEVNTYKDAVLDELFGGSTS